jgi:sugar phosphate isomerase/epimerase
MRETIAAGDWQAKYAISTSIFGKEPLDVALGKIAAGGFAWIEICGSPFHLDPRSEPDVGAARDGLRRNALRVHALHAPYTGMKLGHPDRALIADWVQVIGASLEIGVEIGAALAVVHVNGDPAGLTDAMYDDSKQAAIECIGRLQARAGELGIRLALENMTRRPHLQRRFGMSLQELSSVFPDSTLGFCLDVGHAAACRIDIAGEIAAAGHRLATVHLDSNDGEDDLHWLPPRGIVDWQASKQMLVAGGYAGRYVIELKGYDDPEGIFAQAVAFAKADADG